MTEAPAVWSSAKILEADFAGIEQVLMGWFFRSPSYIRIAKLGTHAIVAADVLHRQAPAAWARADLTRSDADIAAYLKTIKKSPAADIQLIYDQSKRTVHGTAYGLTTYGMVRNFPKIFPTVKVAEATQRIYFDLAPEVPEFHTAVRHTAHQQHYLGGAQAYEYLPAERKVVGHPYGYLHWFWSVVAYERLTESQRLFRIKRGLPVLEFTPGQWYGVKLGEDAKRCVPPATQVWMGDYTYRAIGDLKPGDVVIGWGRRTSAALPSRGNGNTKYMRKQKAFRTDTLQRSRVEAVHHTYDETLTVHLASGQQIRCTRDHQWLCLRRHEYTYVQAQHLRVGDQMCRVDVDDPGDCPPEHRETAAWLAGFYDGEGSHRGVTQTNENHGLLNRAEQAFARLGFTTTRQAQQKRPDKPHHKPATFLGWSGGRQAALKFLRWVPSLRFLSQWADRMLLSSRFRRLDEIVQITANRIIEPVTCITTTTGNFVADGLCSHNCVAFYPQGTARGVLTDACEPLFDPEHPLTGACFIGEEYYGVTPLRAPIHDSLLLEVPTRRVDFVLERVARAMQRPMDRLPCPPEWGIGQALTIGVDAKIGPDWGSMKPVSLPTLNDLGVANDAPYTPAEDDDEDDVLELETRLGAA